VENAFDILTHRFGVFQKPISILDFSTAIFFYGQNKGQLIFFWLGAGENSFWSNQYH
jgi:hypothetical protein